MYIYKWWPEVVAVAGQQQYAIKEEGEGEEGGGEAREPRTSERGGRAECRQYNSSREIS